MTDQMWLTLGVAVLGVVGTLGNGALAGRNATKLALRTRELDQREARRTRYEDNCRELLGAAYLLRAGDGSADTTSADLAAVRRAAVEIGMHNPELANTVVADLVTALERLVQSRAGAWSSSVTEAEAACDRALTAAQKAIAQDLKS